MLRKFISLEWKSFFRSASFKANLAIKILMLFGAIYFIALFLLLGTGAFYIIRDTFNTDPLIFINQFMVYYLFTDLLVRFFLQKLPVVNIKPLLYLPIKKATIVNYTLGKTLLSFFNILHAFFFVPFSIILIIEEYDIVNIIFWHISIMLLIYSNNFLNILISNKDSLFYIVITIVLILVGLHYYNIFDITVYTSSFFNGLFNIKIYILFSVLLFISLYFILFRYFKKNLHLDTSLTIKHQVAKTEQLTWLNQFGTLGTFLKNDIKLIKRNKRSKTTIFLSIMFLFYGLLFFTKSIETYNHPVWGIFAGIFVSGGFLFCFGQFVPSWDSSYYQLMMSQNIQYRDYLSSKWWLIVIATVITTIIASFYLYFGTNVYLAIVAGAIYNIGVNSHLVLWGGAYIKTPIDLSSGKNAFGDKQAFNLKTMLLTIPKLFLPIIIYVLGHYLIHPMMGYVLVIIVGILGFSFRNKVFSIIEKTYKSEKYKTINAYKQKN